MVLPQPRSTLFPYTTLFRSDDQSDQRDEQTVFDHRGSALVPTEAVDKCEHRGDRKSTRLNSSHVKTSYAVFCLKKKIVDETKRFTKILAIVVKDWLINEPRS